MYIHTFIKNTDIFISFFLVNFMICEFCVVARQKNILFSLKITVIKKKKGLL